MIKFVDWNIFWLILSGQICANLACSEQDVKKAIFAGYDKDIRPVRHKATRTNIHIDTEIYSVLSINEQAESIELIIFTSLTWTDEFLRWNKSDFDCTDIRVLSRNIWQPDYVFLNVFESSQIIPKEIQYVSISSNGTIVMMLSTHSTLRCPMDVTKFPFDNQTCIITGALWAYEKSATYLTINRQPSLSQIYSGSPAFDTIFFSAQMHDSYDVYKNATWSEIYYYLGLKRRPEFYIFVLILPSFLLTSLCIIGIFMPSSSNGERNEKMTLGLTTLLSMAIILNITAGSMPKSLNLPLLGYYILYEIIVCSLSTTFSMAIIYVHESSHTLEWNPPKFIRWVANINFDIKTPAFAAEDSGNVTIVKINKAKLDEWNNDGKEQVKNGVSDLLSPSMGKMEPQMEAFINLLRIIANADEYLEYLKKRHVMRRIWIRALNRMDLLLLVIFLVLNCALTYAVLL